MTASIPIDPNAALKRWMAGESLSRGEVADLFGRIMDGEVSDPLKAALLVALAMKGETADEIAGAAQAMRARVVPIPHRRSDLIDTCGTGGDGKGTFNISTAAAFVAAAGGAAVAKHGNRAVSSRSGSADVLAALGVPVEVEPETAARQLDELGIAFLFAPSFHPAMREVGPIRKALGVRTVFNLVGPLTNPAGARRQLAGVYRADRVETLARVLAELGAEHALVVHGSDGLDEITTTGSTLVAEVTHGDVRIFEITPEELDLSRVGAEALAGSTPDDNAAAMERLLGGERGPLADVVAANAGAALYVAGVAGSIREGVEHSKRVLARGEALAKLESLKNFKGFR